METAGLATSAVGIVATFMASLQCFELVRCAYYFNEEYQDGLIRLEILRLRFTRWGESLGFDKEDEAAAEVSLDRELKNPEQDKKLAQ